MNSISDIPIDKILPIKNGLNSLELNPVNQCLENLANMPSGLRPCMNESEIYEKNKDPFMMRKLRQNVKHLVMITKLQKKTNLLRSNKTLSLLKAKVKLKYIKKFYKSLVAEEQESNISERYSSKSIIMKIKEHFSQDKKLSKKVKDQKSQVIEIINKDLEENRENNYSINLAKNAIKSQIEEILIAKGAS